MSWLEAWKNEDGYKEVEQEEQAEKKALLESGERRGGSCVAPSAANTLIAVGSIIAVIGVIITLAVIVPGLVRGNPNWLLLIPGTIVSIMGIVLVYYSSHKKCQHRFVKFALGARDAWQHVKRTAHSTADRVNHEMHNEEAMHVGGDGEYREYV